MVNRRVPKEHIEQVMSYMYVVKGKSQDDTVFESLQDNAGKGEQLTAMPL